MIVWEPKLSRPPMPLPTSAPARGRSASVIVSPASSGAMRAAATANLLKRSILRALRWSMKSVGSKPVTSHAIVSRGVQRLVEGDRPGAATPGHGRLPVLLAADAEGRDHAHAGHHHASPSLPHDIASPPFTESTAPVMKDCLRRAQENAAGPRPRARRGGRGA